MNPSVAVARLTAAAHVSVGLHEQGGANRGQWVEHVLKFVGLKPGQPWCAALVSYLGAKAFQPAALKGGKSSWPLPLTGGCAVLGDFAIKHDLLRSKPLPGDVFLVWFPSKGRFAHTGIIVGECVELGDGRWSATTIEGNTSDGGSREGWGTLKRTRVFGAKDRFIRWTDMLPA